ncbi:lipopolysaccharide heptosyltransferase III [Pseudogulbenkiania sp. NH8B]|uniref:putative lipopolysaccharide heptosyltransferase III n=1 Tax=Pseudogulbenkiania sp. (strain NH8B) TaxID=748280 RepID=UPI000227A829|nr:putative lipopolysaccharide heptosyltransferase III [Pseudogulbenkiania sp. NH8B]BAK78453.1 lipopolysaccharide heptosyltransferase III [Pseudogulbenkiania sp. NH8B]
MLKDVIDLAAVKRVLVIKLRHHGDVLLTSPVFSVLKQHAPHAELDALVYHDTRDMITQHPAVSRVFTIDRQWKKLGMFGQLQAELALLARLRGRHYDLVVHLTEHKRGAWLTRLLKPRWAVARSGNYGKFFARSFTHRYPIVAGNRRHTVELHLDALRRIGIQPGPDERALTLVPGANAEAVAGARLTALGLESQRYILIHPTSRWLFKTWPVQHMASLIDALTARGEQVLLTAAPDPAELAMLEQIQQELARPVASLAGQLTLKELAAVIDQARLFVGMDSVPMHMAAALQTPTVALFGPSGDIEWGPWKVPHRVLTEPLSCRPCGRDGCGGGKVSECLTLIGPERVLAAIDDVLAEVGA